MQISEAIRRDIFDGLRIEHVRWSGRLDEPEFLARMFNLETLPSTDGRYEDAYGDIWQHRINNPDDWDDNWVYTDKRFNLMRGDDQVFLRFLCEMLHPVVRPDTQQCERLRQMFNDSLLHAGYEIVERARVASRPVFAAKRLTLKGKAVLASVRKAFEQADSSYVSQQITRMESAIDSDPSLAIGTAKELVETCCWTILKQRNVILEGHPDLAQLVKHTSKELELTPDDIPEKAKAVQTIRRLLSNLSTITQGIAELRNHYGTGHGKDASAKGLSARHAKLAVGAATTLAVFLIETDDVRRKKD